MGWLDDAVNEINPFDGNDGKGLGGYLQDVGQMTTSPLGPFHNMLPGMNGFDMATNLLGNGGLFATPQQAAQNGGQEGNYMAELQKAMMANQTAMQIAQQQFALGEKQIDAQLQMGQNAMMGGIIGAAMAGQQDKTVRPERLPHETGAIQIAAMDFAMRHEKTMQMRVAGYSDVAIKHQMAGKSYKPLYRDSEWNAMQMMKLTKQDVMQNAQLFGFKTGGNPAGIAMSEDEYLGMMSMKDPNSLLEVNPEVAKMRNAQYAAWKADMINSGNDLVVHMFENPTLSGSSILNMRGKEALIDPRLAPYIKTMNDVKEPFDDLDQQLADYDAMAKPKEKVMSDGQKVWVDGQGNPFGAKPAEGDKGGKYRLGGSFSYNEAMEQYNTGRQKIISEYERKQHEYEQSLEQKFKWDDAIDAMTKGEKNKYTKQIEDLQKAGVIDRVTGQVNGGALKQFLPPDLLKAPPTEMYRKLTPEEERSYRDEYKRLSEVKIDPKLVKVESMGGGVTRKVLLNPDGTRAATMLEGYAVDATGQQRFMSVAGNKTQDFFDRASMISGFGPMGPAMTVKNTREAGSVSKRSTDNYLASYATGQKGNSKSQAMAQTAPVAKNTAKPAAPISSNPAASAGGAPLAAGDD